MLYVEGLKLDLLSTWQLCDSDYKITLYANHYEIRWNGSRAVIGRRIRSLRNVYVLDEIEEEKCSIGQTNNNWFRHKRLGHLNFDNLVKINRIEAVKGDCESCQHGKQAKASFKSNMYQSTTKPLTLDHNDLRCPTKV